MSRSSRPAAALAALIAVALTAVLAPDAGATTPYVRKPPALLTPWTRSVSTVAPLPDYPRPQLQRSRWLNLNGRWQYERAQARARPPFRRSLAQTILVPFPVQSPLSGIERGDTRGWYQRFFRIPAAWRSQHVLLHFGAVSWATRVYVNGRLAGSHRGDYDAFSLDITRLLRPRRPNELTVGFDNPIGAAGEPVGKQIAGAAHGFYHTASSGIWQTVWLEPVATAHLTGLDLTPDVPRSRLVVSPALTGTAAHERVIAQAMAGRRVVAVASGAPGRPFALHIPHPRLWSPSHPYLYGLRVQLVSGGAVVDRARSYFGMRSISLGRAGGATRMLLNGHFLFEAGALDQGYWPDGLYTAPSDAALRFDILAAKRLGYDMVRKHVKVEPDRWYYWADKLGILVWQDLPNMPVASAPTPASEAEFRRELRAVVVQHRSEPSIVTWVPFNEGWGQFDVTGITRRIRRLDPSRLIDSESGSANCCDATESPASDIRDSHLYFGPFAVPADRRASVIGEYGGVLPFPPTAHRWPGVLTSIGSPVLNWGLAIIEPLWRQQYADLTQEMRVQGLSGAVFTELADYEQELGIVSYDRNVYTMPPEFVRRLNTSLIAASRRISELRPQRAAVPPGATGVWHFDDRAGALAADASGQGHPLSLHGGAGWTRGVHGGALAIAGPGQSALAGSRVIDTSRSFTVSAWLNSRRPAQSGTAVSEPGADGSSISLGIETSAQGPPLQKHLALDTRWTFVVPGGAGCTAAQCGVQANARYDDERYNPRVGSWYQVTGAYDAGTHTTSVYVDGVPEDVQHVDAVPAANGPLTVGTGIGVYAPTDTFIGTIDELRTYGRALTPAEVWRLYRAERPAR